MEFLVNCRFQPQMQNLSIAVHTFSYEVISVIQCERQTFCKRLNNAIIQYSLFRI